MRIASISLLILLAGCGGTQSAATGSGSGSGSTTASHAVGGTSGGNATGSTSSGTGATASSGTSVGATGSSGSGSSTGGFGSSSTSGLGSSNTSGGGSSSSGFGSTSAGGGVDGGPQGSICSSQRCVVYASSDTDLYQVDPNSLAQQHLCRFGGDLNPDAGDVVTDIAVEDQGTLYAITEKALYTVDPGSCAASKVASLTSSGTRWVCLSFTSDGTLLGADQRGEVATIDPQSGAVTAAGSFGGTLTCSGDMVAIDDANHTIYATAKDLSCDSGPCDDQLVTLDPVDFHATVVGDTGYWALYGLGYWGGKLYAFQHGGVTISIDPTSGQSSFITSTSPHVQFSGGATTPLAPLPQ